MGSKSCKTAKDKKDGSLSKRQVDSLRHNTKISEPTLVGESSSIRFVKRFRDLVWSNGSKTFRIEKNGWESVISSRELPKYFTVNVKVIKLNGVDKCSNSGLGITTESKIAPNSCIGIKATEYAIMPKTKGDCFIYSGCYDDPINYGMEYSDGDIISIVYKKDNTLSFAINGVNQGVAFRNITGPFYLMASLFFSGSQFDIITVSEL